MRKPARKSGLFFGPRFPRCRGINLGKLVYRGNYQSADVSLGDFHTYRLGNRGVVIESSICIEHPVGGPYISIYEGHTMNASLILLSTFVICVGCAHQVSKETSPRILEVSELRRLDPRLREITKINKSAFGGRQLEEHVGSITVIDALDEQTSTYVKNQREESRRQGNDLTLWNIPGFRLRIPREIGQLKVSNEEARVTYGDFDGDGKADCYAEFASALSENKTRLLNLIWFGGETSPRVLEDFRILEPKFKMRFTGKNFEKAFPPLPLQTQSSAILAEPAWLEVSGSEKNFICWRPIAIPPGVRIVGNAQTANLDRAILAQKSCNTMHAFFYLFSADRQSAFYVDATSM